MEHSSFDGYRFRYPSLCIVLGIKPIITITPNDSNAPNASTRSINLRHEPTALLCRFDWLHLGIVHTKYALCSRFAQSLPRIDILVFCVELPTSNNKPPLQNRRQTESRGCLQTLPRCEGGRPKVRGGGWGIGNTLLYMQQAYRA